MVSDPSRWQSPAPIRYPDPDVIVVDKRFRHLVVAMAAIERIAAGFRFTEGPVYYGDGHYLVAVGYERATNGRVSHVVLNDDVETLKARVDTLEVVAHG